MKLDFQVPVENRPAFEECLRSWVLMRTVFGGWEKLADALGVTESLQRTRGWKRRVAKKHRRATILGVVMRDMRQAATQGTWAGQAVRHELIRGISK
jgi:hypothetical protein